MNTREIEILNSAAETSGKLALEIALAQPGLDQGLLPLNCLLADLQASAEHLPVEINDAVTWAGQLVDEIFNTTGLFDEGSLAQLTRWATWLNAALADALNDRPLAAFVPRPAEKPGPGTSSEEPEFTIDVAGDRELLTEFCNESQEHLHHIEQGILMLEKCPGDEETLNAIFRAFHTFKGGAGLLSLMPIRNLAHELETVLELTRTGRLPADTGIVNLILAGADTLKRFVEEIRTRLAAGASGDPIRVPTLQLLETVRAITSPVVSHSQADIRGDAAPQKAAPTAPTAASPETPLVLDLKIDGELLAEFCNESQEHLQNIEQGVLVLENDPANEETLNTIFRAFHTFKGGAGLLNLAPIKDLAHELETVLDLARSGKLLVTTATINLILAGGDAFHEFINRIREQLRGVNEYAPIVVPTGELLGSVRRLIREDGPDTATNLILPATGTVPALAVAAATHPAPPSAAPNAKPSTGETSAGNVVKVETLKLDSLIDQVGEMVIAQSQVCQDEQVASITSPRLTRNLAQLARITRELQRTAMSLRMIPIRSTFQKMIRLVRDVSSKQGKQVELTMSGEDTELDRTIVEEIGDPLIHMIRNSVDHGIERPGDRVKAGKPATGRVHLSACHQGGNIVIEIRDDGRGLNVAGIRAKGIERGIISEHETLSNQQVFALIFSPGFSTAEVVTDISGRGVGMDVVRRNIEKLRGKIDIDSTPGVGTAFTISLPLTLAIIDGLLVAIGEQRFIIPTLSVRESFRPTREMITTIHGRGEMVDVRGRLCPLLRLHELYGLKPRSTDPAEALLVVVDNGGQTRCLMVDQLVGKQEVVIKNLGETFKRAPAIAGGAILGDGRVGLIIDANSLVNLKLHGEAKAA